jgi:hypothetical protein
MKLFWEKNEPEITPPDCIARWFGYEFAPEPQSENPVRQYPPVFAVMVQQLDGSYEGWVADEADKDKDSRKFSFLDEAQRILQVEMSLDGI